MEGFSNGFIDQKALNRQGFTAVTYGADNELLVKFFQNAVEQKRESELQQRPIFKTEDYIEIHVPGGKEVICRKATDRDKERFPIHWQNYLNGKGSDIVGTPLEQWPMLTVQRVAELKAIKIYTVEQIAAANDVTKQIIGIGAHELQRQAQAFLEAAKGLAPIGKLEAENKDLRNEIESLKAQMKQVLEAQTKKGSRKQVDDPS